MESSQNSDRPKILIVESNAANMAELKLIISSHYEVIESTAEKAHDIITSRELFIASAIIDIRQAAPILKTIRF